MSAEILRKMNNIKEWDYLIDPKERVYYYVRLLLSMLFYMLVILSVYYSVVFSFYIILKILGFVCLVHFAITTIKRVIITGYVKSSSVAVNYEQLPDIYDLVEEYSIRLELDRVPEVYLMESGGILNAFASRMFNSDYVVLYSDMLEDYYNGNEDTVRFVIAHELGHIKRKHLVKEFWLFPANYLPFVSFAYYRACEITCDNIAHSLCPQGAEDGILTLASGKTYRNRAFQIQEVNEQHNNCDNNFLIWVFDKLSTHPSIINRLERIYAHEALKGVRIKPKYSNLLSGVKSEKNNIKRKA